MFPPKTRGAKWVGGLASWHRGAATTAWTVCRCQSSRRHHEGNLGLPVVFEVYKFAEGLVGLVVGDKELGHFFEAPHDLDVGEYVVVVIAGREAVCDEIDGKLHPFPLLLMQLEQVGRE